MEWVAKWAKNLISLVIFAAFLELLLPSSQMQKFLRVIVGLLVMLAILQPLTEVLEGRFKAELPVFSSIEQTKIKDYNTGRNQLQQVGRQVFCRELERRIKTTVEALEGVEAARVMVELETGKEDVKHLTVCVFPGKNSDAVQPISTGWKDFNVRQSLDEPLKNKILHTVAELYQIPKTKITIENE